MIRNPFTRLRPLAIFTLLTTLLATPQTFAAGSVTWAGNTSANWNAAANWTAGSGGSAPPANGDSLIFGAAGTAGTALNNDISSLTLGGITINSGAGAFVTGGNSISLNGNITDGAANAQTYNFDIALTTTPTITLNAGSVVLGGAISGSDFGINKGGSSASSSLTLSGVNSYSGPTAINTGILTLSGAGSIANSAITFGVAGQANTATLTVTPTAAGTATRSASLTRNGGVLPGANNNNNFTVNGVAAGNTIENFGTLTLNPGILRGSIAANAAANTRVVFDSATRNAGSFMYVGRSATTLGAATIASQTAGAANLVFSTAPTLSGNGGSGANISILPWANVGIGPSTYDANNGLRAVSYSSEMVALASGLSLGTGSAGQNARIGNNSGSTPATPTISADTTVNLLSTGTATGGTVSFNNDATKLTVTSGAIFCNQSMTIGSGTSGGNGTLAFGSAEGIVVVENSRTATINSVISGSAGLTVYLDCATLNTANLILANANTFTGLTRVLGNRATDLNLNLNNALALQNTTLDYNNYGAKIVFNNGLTAFTLGGLQGAQNLALANNAAAAVALTIGSSGNSDNTTYSGVLSSTGGSVIKAGSGTLTLTGPNTYDGGTTLNAGVVNAGIAQNGTTSGSLGKSGNIVFGGGTLQFSSASAGWDPSSRIASGTSASAVSIDPNGQNITFGTALTASQSGGLTVNDTAVTQGKLTLSTANAFTGGLTVKAGRVVANGNASAFGDSANTITLGDNSGADATMEVGGAWISDSHAVTVVGSGMRMLRGTWNNSGQIQSWGAITLSNGDIRFQQTGASPNRFGAGLTGTGNVIVTNISSGPTDFRTTGINHVGYIRNDSTGTGGIQQGAAGGNYGSNVTSLIQNSSTAAWTIAQPNSSFWGTVQVLLGTMAPQNTGALNSSNVVSVASGAIFDVQNVNLTIAGLNDVSGAGGTITDTTGSSLHTLTLGGAGNYSFSGAITAATPANRALTINLSNSGVQTLSGANTYTGNTTISAGTLALSGSGSLAALNMAIAPGAKFDVSAVTPSSYSLSGSSALSLNVNKTGATLTQGQLVIGAKTLNYGGTLTVVSNANSAAFANGDSFTLVTTNTGATLGGWFSSVSLPTLSAGLTWDTNDLATTGVLDVYDFRTNAIQTMVALKDTPTTLKISKLTGKTAGARGTVGVLSVSSGTGASVGISGTNIAYTPPTGFTGTDTFTAVLGDGHGSITATVVVTVSTANVGPALAVDNGYQTNGGYGSFTASGLPSTIYNVEAATSLGGPWGPADNSTITASGTGFISYTDTKLISAYGGTVFYRLRQQ